MPFTEENCFLETIFLLRSKEEIVIEDSLNTLSPAQEGDVVDFLKQEYKNETLEYPFKAPDYHGPAALWAAKTVYYAAHFLLNRRDAPETIERFLPPANIAPSPDTLLSADLCLRFLPDLLRQLQLMDREDALIGILEGFLNDWHYSAIGYLSEIASLDFSCIASNPCVEQLFADRVITRRSRVYVDSPLSDRIYAGLGDYVNKYWKGL